jgi:hypothetical protein
MTSAWHGRNRRALDGWVTELRASRKLTPDVEAIIALARSSADAIDRMGADPAVASVMRAHLATIERLKQSVAIDEFDRLVADLSAPMGDPAQP